MGKQYLTFTLADTVYAANVFHVREVLPYAPPQPLPNSDPVIEGLIRSREQSIPVVNLRRKFGLGEKAPDAFSRIIVLEINNREAGVISVFGALADSVNEVLDLDAIGFEDTPELGKSPAAAFIEGIGRQGDAFIIILDVDKIFSFTELSDMREIDNRLVAPEYAKYTQEMPPLPEVAPQAKEESLEEEPAQAKEEPQAVAVEAQAEEAAAEPAPSPDAQEEAQMQAGGQPKSGKKPRAKAAPKPKGQEESTSGRYEALNYEPEDFELL